MADYKAKATTEVPDKEDDLQTEDNFESPLEELDKLGLTHKKKDKRRISSSSSSKSKDETRNRTKLGSVEENEEDTSDSDEEWSEEESIVSFKKRPCLGKRYDVIFTLVNQLTKAIIQCVQSRAAVHQGRFSPFSK